MHNTSHLNIQSTLIKLQNNCKTSTQTKTTAWIKMFGITKIARLFSISNWNVFQGSQFVLYLWTVKIKISTEVM